MNCFALTLELLASGRMPTISGWFEMGLPRIATHSSSKVEYLWTKSLNHDRTTPGQSTSPWAEAVSSFQASRWACSAHVSYFTLISFRYVNYACLIYCSFKVQLNFCGQCIEMIFMLYDFRIVMMY